MSHQHHHGHHGHHDHHREHEHDHSHAQSQPDLEPTLRKLYTHLVEYLDRRFDTIEKEIAMASSALTRLTQEVAETKGAVDSAIALINGLAQQIRDNAEDPAAMLALADELDAQQARVAAAVAANPLPPATPTP